MIFGKDLGRSAFFAEIGSEVERLDNIPCDYTNLVCIGQGVSLTDTVGREYRIDLFISPTGRVAVRLPLPLAGASPTDADPKHLRRVASIVRAWNAEQLNEVCADHFYRTEGQAADIIDVLGSRRPCGFLRQRQHQQGSRRNAGRRRIALRGHRLSLRAQGLYLPRTHWPLLCRKRR